jgi:NAD-dependent epimerase/dehydratase family protein
MRRLLLTGAAGRIAAAVRPELRELAVELVLTDRERVSELTPGERCVRAELEDPAPWDGLAAGCDAVVHLGAMPNEAPFDVLAGPNLRGAFHVYEAARRAGVRRVVVASSGRATGFYRVGERLDGEATPRPDGLYGATKAFSEAGCGAALPRRLWWARRPRQRRASKGRARLAGQRRSAAGFRAATGVDGDYRRQRRSGLGFRVAAGVDAHPGGEPDPPSMRPLT